jgi:hypothetical protein
MSTPTALSVAADLSSHEKVCTERYGNINHQLVMLRASLDAQSVQFSARFNTISSRMWTAALGIAVGAMCAAGALVVLVFNLLQRH